VIPATQGEEIRKKVVQVQPEQNIHESPISINKPNMVAHAYDSSYSGGIGRRITV
jgi:hypothetical protein